MSWNDYWSALNSRQRIGLVSGSAVIVVAGVALAVWTLRDSYVPLATDLNGDRVGELTQALERAKLDYRLDANAETLLVPQSQLSKARAASAGGQFGTPPSVGLELFKEMDFSTTDFAQKINYQRALQGELTRTIQTMAGVRKVRVHVILADGGVFKRNVAKASAAVSVTLQPGKQLTRAQVTGIQRLVTASVPEIKVEDVVVLDESGASLTRVAESGEGELSSQQLELKRQADQYLEGKAAKLLQELVPQGAVSLSIDTTLDYQQLRVTTDEPIAARDANNRIRPTGVVIKERQWQRGRADGVMSTSNFGDEPGNTDWEYEYQVGHRMQQTLSNPGSIKRISVAVALQGAPQGLSTTELERLIAHAVGIDSTRGDSVAVLLLPAVQASSLESPNNVDATPSADFQANGALVVANSKDPFEFLKSSIAISIVVALLLVIAALWARPSRSPSQPTTSDAEVDAVADKVREWLNEGARNDRA